MIIQVNPFDKLPYNDVIWDRVQLAVGPCPSRQWAKVLLTWVGGKAGAVCLICEVKGLVPSSQ